MKIFSYILSFTVFFFMWSQTWANTCGSGCKISDAPSPWLVEYFTNIEKITDNVLESLTQREEEIQESQSVIEESNPVGISRDLSNTKKRVLWALNSVLSFNEYYWSFDFWISLWITNEIPAPVKRDYKKLESQTSKLTSILEKTAKRWTGWAEMVDVCDWISSCSIPNWSASDVLAYLINNNNLLVQHIQSTLLEKPALSPEWSITLGPVNIKSEISDYYNKDTLVECSKCEEGTFANFKEQISEISIKNSKYKQGVQKWKDAWALLQWWNAQGSTAAREREVLSEYLASQWINSDQADIVLWNLDRYNESWLSSSDPLSNSANYTQANAQADARTFQQTLLEKFENDDSVPIARLAEVNTEIKTTTDVAKDISALFEDQKPFSFVQDSVTQELQARILRMHFSLVRSINLLDKHKKIATKACEWPGPDGNCD